MKKYYYVCPRCGRQWVRYIPRSKMKCRFCSESWHTHGRRGTRSRFSWTATFFWLVILAIVALAVFKFNAIVDCASNLWKNLKTGEVQEESSEGQPTRVKVPPIRLRSLDEIESEKNASVEDQSGDVQSSEDVDKPVEPNVEEESAEETLEIEL